MKIRDSIIIEGANQNNLKNVSISIPKNKFVVVTGVSGSGKSSLAFDTVYAEGYRRYAENLSSYAKFFLHSIKKPHVKRIENLSPAIAIDQKNSSGSPRSTVGTMTDVYDFLRTLFAEFGIPHCPTCGAVLEKHTEEELLKKVEKMSKGTQIMVLGLWKDEIKSVKEKLNAIKQMGYARVRIDGRVLPVIDALEEKYEDDSQVEVVVDRMMLDGRRLDKERLIDSLQTAAKISKGEARIMIDNDEILSFSKYYGCIKCDFKLKEITPQHFSFNVPEGACKKCTGLGYLHQVDIDKVIPNKKLSLSEGAIMPWSRNGGRVNGEQVQLLEAFAKKHRIALTLPVKDISQEKLGLLFSGSNEELEIGAKGQKKKKMKFPGVAFYLEEKFQKAESMFTRSEMEKYMTVKECPACHGKRLSEEFLHVKLFEKTIDQIVRMEIAELIGFFELLIAKEKKGQKNNGNGNANNGVKERLLAEIVSRLEPLREIGLGYLFLDRSSDTLSGGEFQRIRLATQLYSGLSGVIYVLDEPSVGLHARDTQKLIKAIEKIKNSGNTVIVVEHDRDIIKAAEYVIDLGPGAGDEGGKIIFEGTVDKLKKAKTETSLYLSNKKNFSARKNVKPSKEKLVIKKAFQNNLKGIDVEIPLKKLVAVAGVSGSGKSSLISDILAKALRQELMGSFEDPGECKEIKGIEKLSKVVIVDQAPIGRSPRSNPATYTGLFSYIRQLFAETEEATKKGLSASHFSFNMRGGRCEYCQGEGLRKIEMHLLDNIYEQCPHCQGTRYNKKMLGIHYHGVNIHDVLEMSIDYAYHFFNSIRPVAEKLEALREVGLGYLRLGQNATELSGGEAQRVKLATELARKSTGKTIYILDEPTIGLHFSDIAKLLRILQNLADKGNSVVVVEHNLDLIKSSDWVIELGPEGGNNGGQVVFEGTPGQLKKANTATGKAMRS